MPGVQVVGVAPGAKEMKDHRRDLADHFAREDAHRRLACLERLAEQVPAPPDVIPVQVIRFDQPWQPDEAGQKPAKGV